MGESFAIEDIVPIPAICTKSHRPHEWIEGNGNGPILAPSLDNCRCCYCGNTLKPHPKYPPVIDALTRRRQQRMTTPKQSAIEWTHAYATAEP